MSRDPSLKTNSKLVSRRSVMTRAERIAKMMNDGKFDPKKDKPLGIPKTLIPKT